MQPRGNSAFPSLRVRPLLKPAGIALAAISIAVVVLTACGQSRMPKGSWPASTGHPVASHREIRILTNPGFVIGYDLARRRAAWVAFRLHAVHGFESMERPDFQPDPRLRPGARRTEYPFHGFDRGHMAPNYAMRQLYGRDAQRASFHYSNVVAQGSRLNQLDWQRLEEIEVDDIAPRVAPLWVVTGPMPVPGDEIPNRFYRIWLARNDNGEWRALAFILPQDVRGDERLSRYRVAIDSIEAVTGLDFFPDLAPKIQVQLEAQPSPASTFGFARYACQPARYRDDWQGRDGIHLNYARCSRD